MPANVADWKRPPSLSTLEPLVNSIYLHYMSPGWAMRPVADLLVRVPGADGTYASSSYKVVPRNYVPYPGMMLCGESRTERCGLAEQLKPLDYLGGPDAPGMGTTFADDDARWQYADASRRVADWNSANSGDLVLLGNMRNGFHFGPEGLRGNHGSLTSADAKVPIAFGYPGWTGDRDTTFTILSDYLTQNGVPVKEAETIRRFFLR
jgi:hypothetical protein